MKFKDLEYGDRFKLEAGGPTLEKARVRFSSGEPGNAHSMGTYSRSYYNVGGDQEVIVVETEAERRAKRRREMEKRAQKRRERLEAFRDRLRAVLSELEDFDRVTFPDASWDAAAFEGTFHHEDGRARFTITEGEKRAKVRGSYTKEQREEMNSYRDEYPSIGVSLSRTPKSIARDIERRFLPDLYAYAQTLNERVEASQKRLSEREQIIRRIKEETGVELAPPSYGSAGDERAYIRDEKRGLTADVRLLSAGQLQIEIRWVNVRTGIEILKLLNA